MPDLLHLKLKPDDTLRIIQALEFYIKSWEDTETCLRHGFMPDDAAIHTDCIDPDAAKKQAISFRRALGRFHRELDRLVQDKPGSPHP